MSQRLSLRFRVFFVLILFSFPAWSQHPCRPFLPPSLWNEMRNITSGELPFWEIPEQNLCLLSADVFALSSLRFSSAQKINSSLGLAGLNPEQRELPAVTMTLLNAPQAKALWLTQDELNDLAEFMPAIERERQNREKKWEGENADGLTKWFQQEFLPTMTSDRPLFKVHYCGHTFRVYVKDLAECSVVLPIAAASCSNGFSKECLGMVWKAAQSCGVASSEIKKAAMDC